jgi:hypothetical protein
MEARVSAYSVERDPNLIILRYRERADECRAFASVHEDDRDRDRYLNMAAMYDRLAEGMETITRARGVRTAPPPEEISK